MGINLAKYSQVIGFNVLLTMRFYINEYSLSLDSNLHPQSANNYVSLARLLKHPTCFLHVLTFFSLPLHNPLIAFEIGCICIWAMLIVIAEADMQYPSDM